MASLLASHDWLVQPWYSQVTITGADSLADRNLTAEPRSSSACEGTTLAIFPSGSDLRIHLRAESWTAEPLTGDPRLDTDAVTWTLQVPAGQITVSDFESAAPCAFELPGPGRYQVRVNAFHTDTRKLYDDALTRSSDFDDPVFQNEVAMLTGRELWLLRLWPTDG
ncbi:hypothetical protein [Actinomadura formosensis]|uniref:hypothetical protein n=1 Tax=Actinomadura formosensis TaxID=60706 RepID=UPI003D938441